MCFVVSAFNTPNYYPEIDVTSKGTPNPDSMVEFIVINYTVT
jgi:hypothetical protein